MQQRILPTEALQRVRSTQTTLIFELAGTARVLAMMPDLRIEQKVLNALERLVNEWASFSETMSTSNPGYWLKDLDEDVASSYNSARHALRILQSLHGPQSADAGA